MTAAAETPKTLALAAGAAVLCLAAYFTRPRVATAVDEAAAGPFFKDLAADRIKGLEIVSFDKAAQGPVAFRVQRGEAGWTIPSRYDYPADAKDSLAKSTGWMASARREAVVARSKDEHSKLGVVDPNDAAAKTEGAGTLFKLFDGSGNAFAQLIVGVPVEGQTDYRYARDPAEDTVYKARLPNFGGTTRFADWIEKDLLELSDWGPRQQANSSGNFKKTIDRLALSKQAAQLPNGKIMVEREPKQTVVAFKPGASEFAQPEGVLEGLGPAEETNADSLRDLVEALKGLKIVDVLPKAQAGITPSLRMAQTAAGQQLLDDLQQQGFLPYKKGDALEVLSLGGEVRIDTKEGLLYTLRFGMPDSGLRGEKADLGAKKDGNDAKKPDDKKPEAKKDEKQEDKKDAKKDEVAGRYLLVSIDFDEKRFPVVPDSPEPKLPPAAPGAKPDPEADKKKLADLKALADADVKTKREKRQKDLDEARKRASELQTRYEKWYYVVAEDDYKKVFLDRAALARPKSAKPDDKKPGAPAPAVDPALPKPPEMPKPAVKVPPPPPEKKPEPMPAPKADAKPPEKKAEPMPAPKAEAKPPEKKPEPMPAPKADAKPVEKKAEPMPAPKAEAKPAPKESPAAKETAPAPKK